MTLHHYDGPTLTLVVNPAAGHGRAAKLLPSVCSALVTGMPGASLRVHQTQDYAEARQRTIAAVEAARPQVPGVRPDALLVMGGDGMSHLGLNACAGTNVPLGIIPAGTGNDFAHGIGVPQSAAAAIKLITQGHTHRIDLMRLEGALAAGAESRYVGSILSTGFDAMVNDRANQMSWPHGGLRYAISTVRELSQFEPLHYRISMDGRPRRLDAMFITVANAGYFGGGMNPSPDYKVDDGLLDVTIIHPVSRMTLLRLLPTIYTGGFVHDPAVEQLQAKVVTIDGDGLVPMADGEYMGNVPVRCSCEPGVLTVFAKGT